MSTDPTRQRGPRTDAARNRDAIVGAAKAVFAEAGIDAPLSLVTSRAGVGRGTQHRHFPTRESLLVAILEEQVEALRSQAEHLLAQPPSFDDFTAWLRDYDRRATAYSGMSTRVAEGLIDDGSPLAQACAPMKAAFSRLLGRAQDHGLVRADLGAVDLLRLVSGLPKHPGTGQTLPACLQLVFDGLRA